MSKREGILFNLRYNSVENFVFYVNFLYIVMNYLSINVIPFYLQALLRRSVTSERLKEDRKIVKRNVLRGEASASLGIGEREGS